jgi:hypothetical protein
VAAPVQDVGTAHPASQQVWHIMCWAGSQATGTGSIGPGPSGLQQAWPFINKVGAVHWLGARAAAIVEIVSTRCYLCYLSSHPARPLSCGILRC